MKNKGSVAAYPANTRGTENPRRFEVPGRKGEREENTIKASSQKYKCMSLFSHMLLPAVPVFPDHFTHPHPHPHLHFFLTTFVLPQRHSVTDGVRPPNQYKQPPNTTDKCTSLR
ncbi:hypothetical protein, unlikely [Trypanosoma brucei gambiense DAL972]|uniref:Uncharacterized protein n=1 Tax=Trypanosoma brucei gambiense (strain MHOM/CI/86/DAL972) TaxID=679716 RepID=D0A0V9_TRYB9|nr:hypothetical protein, unlikely [Trypanosoma brucei gambiense DAL972]CBH16867.1 hypothetical protein, unlikely [Trypanosoma brucei gambiense DAL972]|eukprot:XP_011779131.1 hypothetical protein, unlikely [Trypanosoma brucei gambiense DAL972]